MEKKEWKKPELIKLDINSDTKVGPGSGADVTDAS